MRLFIFALLVASCYASGSLNKGDKLPLAVVTKNLVLPQKTITVQRDVAVKAQPRLVTITRPVPSVPKIVTIDKKVSVPSTPRIVEIHKHRPVKTQVIVPRPIPTPPRIITIERPVPVPQTVIVDKPYLVPTPVIIPRPVPVWVDAKSAPINRAPINLQPIIASGPLPRPMPTPLANPQALVAGRTKSGAITIGNIGGPILVGDKVLEAPLLVGGKAKLGGLAKDKLVASGKLGLAPLKVSSGLPLAWEHNLLPQHKNVNSPLIVPGKHQKADLLVDGNLGLLGAPVMMKSEKHH